MCHCFSDLSEMNETDRTELLEEHSTAELRAEYSADELETLGVTA